MNDYVDVKPLTEIQQSIETLIPSDRKAQLQQLIKDFIYPILVIMAGLYTFVPWCIGAYVIIVWLWHQITS
jgi:hypothetical protein